VELRERIFLHLTKLLKIKNIGGQKIKATEIFVFLLKKLFDVIEK